MTLLAELGLTEWDSVARYLDANYLSNREEVKRVEEAKKRDEYFEGGGEMGILRIIETAFSDPLTRKLRSDLVAWAKWNNVIRRVATELATVYNEEARRSIASDNDQYQAFLRMLNPDVLMREVDTKLVYHEDVWVQYRVRKSGAPALDIVSPAKFWAVAHPGDVTSLLAIILDQKCSDDEKKGRYLVWTPWESFRLDGAKRYMGESLQPHDLGRIPGELASIRPPSSKGCLLAKAPAADLVAAHEAIWFLGVLLLKESKSANNQTYLTGDTSAAVMGQSADTEREAVLPEGVSIQSVDRGMNLEQFRETATHILEQAAANHGLPPSVLHQRDAASGAEIHLRRIPIRELRKKRIPILRAVERRLVEVQALVNRTDAPQYTFIPADFTIDFGEVQQPLTEAEQDAVFEQRRRLGLTDTVEELRRRNPDLLSDEAAEAELRRHVEIETKRVELMKQLMALNGSMGSPTGESTPQQNGAKTDGVPA